MWRNFACHSVSFNDPYNISVDDNVSINKMPGDKQIIYEKEFNLESDTDFKSFLLPLEQDFTKSSKGYASLLSTVSDNEMKSINYRNKLEGTQVNKTLNIKHYSDTDYLRNTNDKFLHNNFPCSNDHRYTEDIDNLCNLKYKKNIDDEYGESVFSKIQDLVTEKDKNVIFLENIIKVQDFSMNISKPNGFYDKIDHHSESTEIKCLCNDCNNPVNFVHNSSSDDDIIIFSDEVAEVKKYYSTVDFKQVFASDPNSNNFDDRRKENCWRNLDGLKTSVSEDFEFTSCDILENSLTSQKNLYDSTVSLSSEGYINACFEDDIFTRSSSILESINENWRDLMKDISEEPHESKKVSFAPLPHLVTIYSYEPEDDNYRYSIFVLDQLRFQNRIKDFEYIIAPYLTSEYRTTIFERNCSKDNHHDHITS